eukprot:gb/GFBE01083343.1/.p1 GENE.gb/GFBE01083343.1/~~gb/GFBE01083343.1/.p1  ORF type:complete len:304 (+),score=36.22 gb/GFBE01083343.1/:1-912(+)
MTTPGFTQPIMLPFAAMQNNFPPSAAGQAASRSPAVCTPLNAASTYWRTTQTPLAPARPARRQAGQSPFSDVITPDNVATTAWRHTVCPNAPIRREGWTASSSPASQPASPIDVWPQPAGSPMSCVGSLAYSPMAGVLQAPSPRHALHIPALARELSLMSDVSGSQLSRSPEGSPLNALNTAFIVSPTNSPGAMSVTHSPAGDASPFFVDVTPVPRVPSASPIGQGPAVFASFENFGAMYPTQKRTKVRAKTVGDLSTVQEAEPRRPLGVVNMNTRTVNTTLKHGRALESLATQAEFNNWSVL